jgi:hypothetical protein
VEVNGEELVCQCGNKEFDLIDAGPDSYDDDITYTAYQCTKCGRTFHDWKDGWWENN